MAVYHVPIMVSEVCAYLAPERGGAFIDCTVGGGGHTQALLERGPECTVIGIDRDQEAINASTRRLEAFGDRVRLVHADYRQLPTVLAELGLEAVDGVLFDLGVASHQLDDPARGFSYQHLGPLDMRMDRRQSLTARELVNRAGERELRELIRTYGEERWAGRIARHIVAARQRAELTTTADLVRVIEQAYPGRARQAAQHPARRTFQALRIAVNRELEGLGAVLHAAVDLLRPGGRIVVLAFHSLEDRVVKDVLRRRAGACVCPPGLPVCRCGARRDLEVLTPRALRPSADEIAENPRARSARLRAAVRTAGF